MKLPISSIPVFKLPIVRGLSTVLFPQAAYGVCPYCGGSGWQGVNKCPVCHGTGKQGG